MANFPVTLKRGASGTYWEFELKDEGGELIDLTGWASVHVVVAKSSAVPVLDEACTIDADPTTGRVSYEFDATTSDITPGEYDLELHAIDATGDLHIFPAERRYPYGKVIVFAPKQRAA